MVRRRTQIHILHEIEETRIKRALEEKTRGRTLRIRKKEEKKKKATARSSKKRRNRTTGERRRRRRRRQR